ncbi:type II toxin-antitoxin system RelE/ParE family toxin [Leptobacterium sp. I13]|uniref:type II toxin-antitoxin system RelE/ParE family toxin n=1 Tax=Leptobacterium meishanense TaxID=3128904 RepID=UPI0030EC7390
MGKSDIKPVELTKRAIKDLNKIKSFNRELLGEEKAVEIIAILFKRMSMLESTTVDLTNIGAVDEYFSHLKYEYRKLLEDYYKITYRIGKEKIYIIRVFDTRQHPNKNK